MECFVTEDGLLINELAPARVHTSGHWTQNGGTSVSQFELHLRAILDLPAAAAGCHRPGGHGEYYRHRAEYTVAAFNRWRICTGMTKKCPARKVGHINLTHQDPGTAYLGTQQAGTGFTAGISILLPDWAKTILSW